MKQQKQKKNNYINNKDMLEEVIKCQKNGMKISPELGKMFILMARKYANLANFSNYSYIEDMIASGILSCVIAFPKFDATRSNSPFSYFTQVIYHSFLQTLNKEKAIQNTKDRILIDNGMNPSFNFTDEQLDVGDLD